MSKTYAFGKRGHTNVSKGDITDAIATFKDEACNAQFPSMTLEERKTLITALRSMELARAQWIKDRK